jgi:hypothetical protein
MGKRRGVKSGKVKAKLIETQRGKGRKRPFMPRGGQIPPNKVHKPKMGEYDRRKEKGGDWTRWLEDEEYNDGNE